MRMETFIGKALGLKAHRVVKIEEDEAAGNLLVYLDRREHRRLSCGECGRGTVRIAPTRRPERRWRDLAVREYIVELVYAPCRVRCPHCGLRIERVPWAAKWQRVTHALARAVATLARELTWSAVAHHFRVITWLGPRRARAIHTVSCDMCSVYIDAVEAHLPPAALVFDRFHLSHSISAGPSTRSVARRGASCRGPRRGSSNTRASCG